MHDNAGNYTELGIKCTGLEANYQSARLYRGGVHQGQQWLGSGTVWHTKLATSPPQGTAGPLIPDLEFTALTVSVTVLMDS